MGALTVEIRDRSLVGRIVERDSAGKEKVMKPGREKCSVMWQPFNATTPPQCVNATRIEALRWCARRWPSKRGPIVINGEIKYGEQLTYKVLS